MSTSLLYHAFSIRGYEYVRTEYQGGNVVFAIQQAPKTFRCEACGSRDVPPRGRVERRFQSLPIGNRPTVVVLPIPRVACQACGVVRQVKLEFADPRRTYTRAFERYALELSRSMTILDVARHLGVSWDIIKDLRKRPAVAPLCQAEAQAPPPDRHRRDRCRQRTPLHDRHPQVGKLRVGLRRRGQGGRRAQVILEAAATVQGEDRRGGHGYVARLPRCGLVLFARGDDRLRPFPRHEAVQRKAVRPSAVALPPSRQGAEDGAQGVAMAPLEGAREPRS